MIEGSHSLEVKLPSNRNFGLVFTVFFALVGFAPLRNGMPVRHWALVLSGALLVVTLVIPHALRLPNKAWAYFGILLSKVTNPLIMGVVFYGVITPLTFILNTRKKDPLRLRLDPEAETYWIKRPEDKYVSTNLKNQY